MREEIKRPGVSQSITQWEGRTLRTECPKEGMGSLRPQCTQEAAKIRAFPRLIVLTT